MRRYDDPVEVRRGALDDERGPEQFLWRGRLWKVRAVLAHWVETGAWWQSHQARAVLGTDAPGGPGEPGDTLAPVRDLLADREVWRVRAGRGGLESDGVFELCFDYDDGSWQLVGCED